MFKKATAFLVIACLIATTSNAQSLMQGFGSTISVLFGKIERPFSSYTLTLQQTNFTYFPRYNFVENDNSSVSIGLPVSVGLGIASNRFADDAGLYFSYDLPAVVDYNFGCKSTMDNEETFGGYFGAGFGYNKISISKSQESDFNGASYGPLLRGGVRISSTSESWAGRALTIGLFYKKGMEKDKLTTIGFNVMYDL